MTDQSPNKMTALKKIRPGLAVFKTGQSQFWSLRFYDSQNKRYIVRSTRETDRISAQMAAEEFVRSLVGQMPPPPPKKLDKAVTVEHFANRVMQINAAGSSKFTARDEEKMIKQKDIGILDYFGKDDIRTITTNDIWDYFLFMDEGRDQPLSWSTKSKFRIVLKKVFTAAIADGTLGALPVLPTFKQKDTPRISFNDAEYTELLKVAKECAKRGDKVASRAITISMYYMIGFLVNSFMRPLRTELFALRNCDITRVDDPKALHIEINGKTGRRTTVTMPAAVDLYLRQIAESKATKPTDYVFFPDIPSRSRAMEVARDQFNHVLDEAKLKQNIDGELRSLYSLRHYSIQKRIRNSGGAINLYVFAKNIGTSVEMIERFYAKYMPISDSLIENLHTIKQSKKKEN